ncbi:MAG: 4-alpha-glucanotransferase [Acidobacteria bacterium]|nr:4-alpha-glucanotransferase [Acidobacteriota bacterium]
MAGHETMIAEALRILGVDNLVLAVHDACFPGLPGQDTGRGTPCSEGAGRFLRFVRDLGFTGLQFGPQGQTSDINASPYDGTVFSRNILSIALHRFAEEEPWGELLGPHTLERWAWGRPAGSEHRTSYRYAFAAARACLQEIYDNWRRRVSAKTPDHPTRDMDHAFRAFREENRFWLERDSLYAALVAEYRGAAWIFWPTTGPGSLDRRLWAPLPGEETSVRDRVAALRAKYAHLLEEYCFRQFLAHDQHRELRQTAAGLRLKLYGDLQIGISVSDAWAWQSLYMTDYLMGAPPSRTNPEGQPWNFPVLDPRKYRVGGRPGPALELMRARMDKTFAEYDGVRLDHPHGHICPWVYRADDPDPLHAVQNGARLFCSPDLPDHPALASLAIPRPGQINRSPGVARYADEWVKALEPAQVERYSVLFDVIVEAAHCHGRRTGDILAEVLSTMPYPLGEVLKRYGLGRFRVTQKANLQNPEDVYRTENARSADWVMTGNHDTPPLRLLAERWHGTPAAAEQAAYLGAKLCPDASARPAFVETLEADPGALVRAKFADLLACPARNVMVFFTDLFGMREIYNAPGTVNESNWMLRVPEDYAAEYERRRQEGFALDIPRTAALALRARGLAPDLATRLEQGAPPARP